MQVEIKRRGRYRSPLFFCDVAFDNGQVEFKIPLVCSSNDKHYYIRPATTEQHDENHTGSPTARDAIPPIETDVIPAVDEIQSAPPETDVLSVARAAAAFNTASAQTFLDRWSEYARAQAAVDIVQDCPAPPANTVCAECREAISAGQKWHAQCFTCKQPVHADPACSTQHQGNIKCLRCHVNDTCPVPQPPSDLIPGSKEHGMHPNNKTANLKKRLLHGNPCLSVSSWSKPQLYLELYGVSSTLRRKVVIEAG